MMTIKDGKFYKDGVHVPIEHGNKEQIQILKRIEEMREGFDPEITIYKKIVMEFTCVCGKKNKFDSFTEIEEDDPETMIKGEKAKCIRCGLSFRVMVFSNEYNEFLQLKLEDKK